MKTITITNQKGGVAKTSLTLALAYGLKNKCKRVLIVDADPQSNTSFVLGVDLLNAPTLYDVMTKAKPVEECIAPLEIGIDVIPGGLRLASADIEFTLPGREYLIKEALAKLEEQYDYCIIDTAPSLGILTINALTACTDVLIPVQADVFSLQGVGQLSQTISTVKQYCNHDLRIAGIVVTRYNARTVLSKDIVTMLEDTAQRLDTRLFNTKIRECVAVREAQAQQKDIFEYAPKSNAANDYNSLIEEILEVMTNEQ